ncbi:MAG: hypothetical protein OXE56_03230 [Gammaproteobacteria bacterium]|nr:hypothetical protein [Gammaproteobacteria bacterium]
MSVSKPTCRKVIFLVTAFTWLPAGITLISFIRFGLSVFQNTGGADEIMLMFYCSLSGFFLAFACKKLWFQERKTSTVMCAVLLGPITIFGVLIAGLLGPIMMLLYAAIISIPAWLAVFIFYKRGRNENK